MATPEEMFTLAFTSTNSRFSTVYTLRQIASLGLPAATPQILENWNNFATELFHDPRYDGVFTDKKGALEAAGGIAVLGQQISGQQIQSFQAAIDAAALIFAHSIVDAAAFEYLKVTFASSPVAWYQFVENKQVKLSDLNGKDWKTIQDQKAEEFLNSLDRQSLLYKSDILFQICQPQADFSPIKDYKFDRTRLERLDVSRHELIHGSGPVVALPNGEDDILFLQQTTNYFMSLVNMRFNTRINTGVLARREKQWTEHD